VGRELLAARPALAAAESAFTGTPQQQQAMVLPNHDSQG